MTDYKRGETPHFQHMDDSGLRETGNSHEENAKQFLDAGMAQFLTNETGRSSSTVNMSKAMWEVFVREAAKLKNVHLPRLNLIYRNIISLYPPKREMLLQLAYPAFTENGSITVPDLGVQLGSEGDLRGQLVTAIINKYFQQTPVEIPWPSTTHANEEFKVRLPEHVSLAVLRRNWEIAQVHMEARYRVMENLKKEKKRKADVEVPASDQLQPE